MKNILLALLLLSATPATAYRLLGFGQPSAMQRSKYLYVCTSNGPKWIRLTKAQRLARASGQLTQPIF